MSEVVCITIPCPFGEAPLVEEGSTYPGGNTREKNYTQKNVGYGCKAKSSTTWAGTTLGTIRYNGRTYYARVYQAERKLPCKA